MAKKGSRIVVEQAPISHKQQQASQSGTETVPRFKTVVQHVDLKPEIETKLRMMVPDIKAEFLFRIISFALSGTCLVDLKRTTEDESNCTAKAKLACSLSAKQLTKLLQNQIMTRRKSIYDDDIAFQKRHNAQKNSGYHEAAGSGGAKKVFLSDSFQEIMFVKLFGFTFCIVHNDVLCVASLAADDDHMKETQELATRYFAAQLWCEFTKEVLTEFLNEDFQLKEAQWSNNEVDPKISSVKVADKAEKTSAAQKLDNEQHDLVFEDESLIKTQGDLKNIKRVSGDPIEGNGTKIQLSEHSAPPVKEESGEAVAKDNKNEDPALSGTQGDNQESSQRSIVVSDEQTRRNFYLTLFRLYSAIPFKDCVNSFAKIFNDVFVHERPSCVHKYSLTEVMVAEMLQASEEAEAKLNETHKIPFAFNFMNGSTKALDYQALPSFHSFLNKAIRQIKRNDLALGARVDLHKRGRKTQGQQQYDQRDDDRMIAPQNGHEFFFSNVMVKVYQVPVLFHRSSEETESQDEGTFIVLIFEKMTRKRTYAKTTSQFQRLRRANEVKKVGEKRYVEELLMYRDSKMRRFCNYFVTLFNQKKINPFTQFIQQTKLKLVKANVREKMDLFTNGQLKPPDDPEMGMPIIDPNEAKEGEDDEKANAEKKANSMGENNPTERLDEFKDKCGLHYKESLKVTSQTPNPPELQSSSRQFGGIAELGANKYQELSKASLHFPRSGSNLLSSIVHMEEVSAGYYSIDRHEYRLQKKVSSGKELKGIRTSRSSQVLKDEPFEQQNQMPINHVNKDSVPDLKQMQRQLQAQEIENAYGAPVSSKRGGLYEQRSPSMIKEGELMRKSAQALPSMGSRLDSRESQNSIPNRSFRDKDSMMSLFQQIPDKLMKSQIRNKESRRSQSSLSGISKDFTDMFINKHSILPSEDDNNSLNFNENSKTPREPVEKKLQLKSRLKKRPEGPPPFAKGFSLGHSAQAAPGYEDIEVGLRRIATGVGALENIKEEEVQPQEFFRDYNGNEEERLRAGMSPTSQQQNNDAAQHQRSARARQSGKSSIQPSSHGNRAAVAVVSPESGSYESEYDGEDESSSEQTV